MKIKTLGFVSAADAPEGSLIAYPNGTMIVVSEYGRRADRPYPDCYIVGSGEFFCGDYSEKGLLISIEMDFERAENEC